MRRHFLLASLFIFLFGFFVLRSSVTQDPDFGWHLQFGRLLLATGKIPLTDPYSYTMPSYHFVNHEWGMDIFMSSVYDQYGIWPLIVGFSLFGFCTMFVLTMGISKKWVALPLFLVGGTLIDFIGVRPQVVSFFFLAILCLVLFQKNLWQRFCWTLPLLFLLWANLHGGFAIGIVVLGIFVFGKMLELRQFAAKDFLVFILCLFATLCNPYGYHLWTEVAKSATDPALRTAINEWYPAIYFENIAFWIYWAISFFLIIRYYQKFSPTVLVLYGFLFLSAMASLRNIPIFVIVSFYPTMQGISYLAKEAGNYLYGKERFVKGYIGFFLISLVLFLSQLGVFTYRVIASRAQPESYPKSAVLYLRSHMPGGQIFSSYEWGGYLIWQLPEKKVFIDGRMPSWRNPYASSHESTYAFGEYQAILQNRLSFEAVSKKYGIDTLLIAPSDLKEEQAVILGVDLEKIPFVNKFFRAPMSFAPVVAQIKRMGWKEVYRDNTAIVYENISK